MASLYLVFSCASWANGEDGVAKLKDNNISNMIENSYIIGKSISPNGEFGILVSNGPNVIFSNLVKITELKGRVKASKIVGVRKADACIEETYEVVWSKSNNLFFLFTESGKHNPTNYIDFWKADPQPDSKFFFERIAVVGFRDISNKIDRFDQFDRNLFKVSSQRVFSDDESHFLIGVSAVRKGTHKVESLCYIFDLDEGFEVTEIKGDIDLSSGEEEVKIDGQKYHLLTEQEKKKRENLANKNI